MLRLYKDIHTELEVEGVKIENKLTGPGIKAKICKKCLPSHQKNCGSSWTFQIPISSFKLEFKKNLFGVRNWGTGARGSASSQVGRSSPNKQRIFRGCTEIYISKQMRFFTSFLHSYSNLLIIQAFKGFFSIKSPQLQNWWNYHDTFKLSWKRKC